MANDSRASRPTSLKAATRDRPSKSSQWMDAYRTEKGQSIFRNAETQAPEQAVARVKAVIGDLGPHFLVRLCQATDNPLFLWVALIGVSRPEDIPPQLFAYLKDAGREMFAGVATQLTALDSVKVAENEEMPYALQANELEAPALPNIVDILGLARPSVNLFQKAARDLRDLSYAIAAENIANKDDIATDEIVYNLGLALGKRVGRGSQADIAEAAVQKHLIQGRKILRKLRNIAAFSAPNAPAAPKERQEIGTSNGNVETTAAHKPISKGRKLLSDLQTRSGKVITRRQNS